MKDPSTSLLPDREPAGEATLRGAIRSIVFRSSDGRFGVATVVSGDGREHTLVGDLGELEPGEQVRAAGRWETHSTRGRRLRVEAIVPELPTTPAGIERLLGSGFVDGIGAGMAKRIVDTFGSATLDVILDHPERLREVSGVGAGRVKKIRESFSAKRAEAEARSFLQAAGIGAALAVKVIKKYGDQTTHVVRENPYRLALDVPGIGFRTADRIGSQLGIGRDDTRRAFGAVVHLLSEAADAGHTGVPPGSLIDEAVALDIPAERVDPALRQAIAAHHVVEDFGLLYPPPLHRAEKNLARDVRACVEAMVDPIAESALADKRVITALQRLNEKQQQAVRSVREHGLLVMTGGPGTGKTTAVQAMVMLMRAARKSVALAAPTGRAAKRLTEATAEPARTIHRLLEWNPRLGRFSRDADSPLDADFVLVDEASMLDVVLASRLLAAVRPGARLVLVGDADQLPSVGAGTVLADLLATPWIPVVRLTEVFRQAAASMIVQAAHAVLRGEMPTTSPPRPPGTQAPPNGEVFLVASDDAERAAQLLVSTVVERIPRSFGLDPVRDVQVLVPTHRGALGTVAINQQLQRALNPAARDLVTPAGATPRPQVGDKVMQVRNDYDLEVWNGDIGTVSRAEGENLWVSVDGREVRYAGDARDALVLAYAVSVHKSQGSEYDAVVIGMHSHHYVLLNRPLLYTALTRAKRLVVLVGSPRAIRMAVENARTAERWGALRARLAAPA